MKVVLLTSNALRHKYIANSLAKYFDLRLIITEKKSPKIEETNFLSIEDEQFVKNHFKKRFESEKYYFNNYSTFPTQTPHLQVLHGDVNGQATFDEINVVNPDVIILFGTSIIKNHLLEKYPNKIINLHLGLSPYYKGSATNIFPILYKELECVGATIHIATSKVDGGSILHQLRPDIEQGDSIHDIGNKVILKSGKELPLIIKRFLNKDISISQQKIGGKVCRIKDLKPTVLKEIYNIFNKKLVEYYLLNINQRINNKPIIENL